MQTFIYNPELETEENSLSAFNEKIWEFCTDDDNRIIAILYESIGPSLVVTCQDIDDLPAPMHGPMHMLLAPVISPIYGSSPDLEDMFNNVYDQIDAAADELPEEEDQSPVQQVIVVRKDKPDEGWVCISCGLALIVNEGYRDPDDDDDDYGDGGPVVGPPPADGHTIDSEPEDEQHGYQSGAEDSIPTVEAQVVQ